MITSIQKWGNSQGIRIPKVLLDALQIKVDEQVEIEVIDEGILIHKVKHLPTSLDEVFAEYTEEYTVDEADWGDSVGKEV